MIITNRQILMLLNILKDTLQIHNMGQANRIELYDEIINQQSNKLIDVDEE